MKKTILTMLVVLALLLSFTGCTSTWQKVDGVKAVREYKLVGYDFLFTLDGNSVTYEYVDAVGDSRIPLIAETLGAVLPGYVGYEYPAGGMIILQSKCKLTEAQFDEFVTSAEALIYNTIY